jgi:hypothetical protein
MQHALGIQLLVAFQVTVQVPLLSNDIASSSRPSLRPAWGISDSE